MAAFGVIGVSPIIVLEESAQGGFSTAAQSHVCSIN